MGTRETIRRARNRGCQPNDEHIIANRRSRNRALGVRQTLVMVGAWRAGVVPRYVRFRYGLCAAVMVAGLLATGPPAVSADPENCLLCHRYRGLARIEDDGHRLRLFHVNADYFDRDLGPHARLRCTDCHPRDQVAVIPHLSVSKVDCTTQCHITSPSQPAREFSHTAVGEMLNRSVHTPEVLSDCNALLGSPLAPEQARCLLCHDEPTFDRPGINWPRIATQRCDLCHTESSPYNTQFALRHVLARSMPARTHEQLARSCALCHSNRTIRAKYRLPDSVASYLHSFHGKAMSLGSDATAGCLDCHVDGLQNVHFIRSHTDADSPVSPARIADTCRSAACHPGAGTLVTAAAVHMELSPSRLAPPDESKATTVLPWSSGYRFRIEHLIALMFVVLILCTFGPSAILQVLELLQIVLNRHERQHGEKIALVRRLRDIPQARRALVRFTPHQRVQHWVLAVSFITLVITGFPIKFADRAWAGWAIQTLGGLTVARHIHRYAGMLLICGAFYHAVYVAVYMRSKIRGGKTGIWKTLLHLPMVVSGRDIKELLHLLGYLLFIRRTRPMSGRFSLKEKFEYFGVFWGCALLGVTGLAMWQNAWTSQVVSGRMLTLAALIHTMEALLALLHVGLLHLIGVVFSPHVLPVSTAMFDGQTPPEEMADAHGGMVAQVAAAVDVPAEVEADRG